MKNLILYIGVFALLSSCNPENGIQKFTLEPSNDSIYINLGKDEFNFTFCSQFFSTGDSNFLAIKNGESNSIFLYNIEKQNLFKKIAIDLEGVNAFPHFTSFLIKNLDTIILLSTMPAEIAIINGNGEIIKKIPIKKDIDGKSLRPADGINGEKLSLKNDTLYLFQQLLFSGYTGKFDSDRREKSEMVLAIDLKNDIVKSLPLKYPKELVDKDIFNMTSLWENGHNNSYVYLSSILPYFFVTRDLSEFKVVPIQTKYKLDLPENLSKFGNDINGTYKYVYGKDWFSGLMYDKYRECYYLLVQKRIEDVKAEDISRTNFVYPNCLIIILDKNFKHMGDAHFPENIYSFKDMFVTKEGVYISEDNVNNPTYSEDAMRFRLFKLKEI